MPSTPIRRNGIFNTPAIRTGGIGALQVEALTNRPLSIARRHLAASQLRMRDIEPDELSSSDWVCFLVMPPPERERWIAGFVAARRRRQGSAGESDSESEGRSPFSTPARTFSDKSPASTSAPSGSDPVRSMPTPVAAASTRSEGRVPPASIFARGFDRESSVSDEEGPLAQRPRHARRAVSAGGIILGAAVPPPTYGDALRSRGPPPAYRRN
ncbi:uncharacterized protein K489DRAFT_385517 [Dissoconium aciculare CBS 342.82]|jgi:hypothetical protein|uniref:Uncharacterized protein n=1 Tax=Dissoconium aciculare CBS 342.82 TaxID=1314786 RepID=A0A6J3LQ71_9PEZI|nr:uncharacterized protein K489DRAFT_385517 [Dissoconium aciculare CBS 342.82]KAF1817793.1 hypothetical protein K489DRAFT_385517 [Dissoconium aciculare CBS 342.82]